MGSTYPSFQDPSLPWSDRVDDLIGRLTIEELMPQTMAIYGSHVPAIDRLGIKPYVWISECLRGQAMTNTTSLPQGIGLAAAFSPEFTFNISEAVSYEVRAHWNENVKQGKYEDFKGLSCFSPVINIMRHLLWGRNQEIYREDPYLSSVLVKSFVKGLQGDHPRYVRANAGCKYFDVYVGPENITISRWTFDAKVSTHDWRMTFLPSFKACVEAGTYSIMCSYNSINGIPACANKQLLTAIARKEWGFTGYIVSDAGAVNNIMKDHHYLNNSVDTVTACMKAGCNLELGSTFFKSFTDSITQGKLTEKEVHDNMKPLFYTHMRLGEFDPIQMNPYNTINISVLQSHHHRNIFVSAALQTFVLMKNLGNVLPIKKV